MVDDRSRRILIIDDDRDTVEIVGAILRDEGYEVSVVDEELADVGVILRGEGEDVSIVDLDTSSATRATIGRWEPDCILLDSGHPRADEAAWTTAAEIRSRRRPIPTVMFSALGRNAEEASEGTSRRAKAAGFAAVLRKPFELDELLAVVAQAVVKGQPFDRSRRAEQQRTRDLVARLAAAGARDIRASTRREWVTFQNHADEEMQLYWWQSAGRYLVGRYTVDGARLELVGRFFEAADAIRAATEEKESGQRVLGGPPASDDA